MGKIDDKIQILSAEPDIYSTPITSEDIFIITATDALWDVMSDQEAINYVLQEMKKLTFDPLTIGQKLADKAFVLGSGDNITICITFFTHHKEKPREDKIGEVQESTQVEK